MITLLSSSLIIEKTYTGTFANVMMLDGLTEAFAILAGVLQGDTLAHLYYCLGLAVT